MLVPWSLETAADGSAVGTDAATPVRSDADRPDRVLRRRELRLFFAVSSPVEASDVVTSASTDERLD